MENNDLSFEDLVSMSNFDLDSTPTDNTEVEITLNNEEVTPPVLEQEEVTTPKAEEPEPTVEVTLEAAPTLYSELAKEKLASGEWEDVLIEVDGKEVKLSELDTVDKDTYSQIQETFKKDREEELKTKYVSVEGLNETQKALINIIKTGDLEKAKELFEQPQQLQEPFQGYDSENDKHNEQVLSWYYSSLGHSPEEVVALVNTSKQNLTIDDKAQKIVEFQKAQFKENILKKDKELQEEKLAEQEKIKVYRKDLIGSLKEEGITETMAKKFADVATKYDSDGNLEIDNILDDILSDPKKAKDLIFFALDKEGYLKKATNEVKKDVQKDILKKVSIIRDTAKTASTKEEETQKDNNPFAGLQFD